MLAVTASERRASVVDADLWARDEEEEEEEEETVSAGAAAGAAAAAAVVSPPLLDLIVADADGVALLADEGGAGGVCAGRTSDGEADVSRELDFEEDVAEAGCEEEEEEERLLRTASQLGLAPGPRRARRQGEWREPGRERGGWTPRLNRRAKEVFAAAARAVKDPLRDGDGEAAATPRDATGRSLTLTLRERGGDDDPRTFSPRLDVERQRVVAREARARQQALDGRMHAAADEGDFHGAYTAAMHGADIGSRGGKLGGTLLHKLAAVCRDERLLATFLGERIDPALLDAGSDEAGAARIAPQTCCHVAVRARNDIFLRAVLARDASVATRVDGSGRTPLHLAAEVGSESIARLLVPYATDGVDAVDAFGYTALHYAARVSRDVVALLLSHGARRDLVGRDGRTPFLIAQSVMHRENMVLLGEA